MSCNNSEAFFELEIFADFSNFEQNFLDNAATSSEKDQPEGDLLKMAQFQTNTESLMYLQECINDLQD